MIAKELGVIGVPFFPEALIPDDRPKPDIFLLYQFKKFFFELTKVELSFEKIIFHFFCG